MEKSCPTPRTGHDLHVDMCESAGVGYGTTSLLLACPRNWGMCDAYRPSLVQFYCEGQVCRQECSKRSSEDHHCRVRGKRRLRLPIPFHRIVSDQIRW